MLLSFYLLNFIVVLIYFLNLGEEVMIDMHMFWYQNSLFTSSSLWHTEIPQICYRHPSLYDDTNRWNYEKITFLQLLQRSLSSFPAFARFCTSVGVYPPHFGCTHLASGTPHPIQLNVPRPATFWQTGQRCFTILVSKYHNDFIIPQCSNCNYVC